MGTRTLAVAFALSLCCPLRGQQAETIPYLLDAVGADAAAWTAAVERCVGESAGHAAGDRHVIDALGFIARAEALRPVGPDTPVPDADVRERIRELLLSADQFLAAHRRGEQYRIPARFPQPPPAPPPGAPRPEPPPTPRAVLALIDAGFRAEHWMVAERVLTGCRFFPYPELAALYEHIAVTSRNPWHHSLVSDAISQGLVRAGHVEAAGLLLMLRQSGWLHGELWLARRWRDWSSERVARAIPFLFAKCTDPRQVASLARAFTQMTGRELPPTEPWSAQVQGEIFRAARDIVAEIDAELPPLVDPAWDAEAEVVQALQGASYEMTVRAQVERAQDPAAEPDEIRAALQRLVFEDTDESRGLLEERVRTDDRWLTVAYCLHLVGEVSPQWAGELRGLAVARLAAGPEGAPALAAAIAEARTQETVLALASLAGAAHRDALVAGFRELALAHTATLHVNEPSFAPLRNSITAWGAFDRDGAVAFYRPLLAGDAEQQREIGVYAMGELNAVEAVPELLALMVPEQERAGSPASVCTALAKIASDEARDALIGAITALPGNREYCSSMMTAASRICGLVSESPPGTWANGRWGWPAPDVPAVANRVIAALEALAARTGDEDIAHWARSKIDYIRHTLHLQAPPAPPAAP